jgi:cation:H+ antiporter
MGLWLGFIVCSAVIVYSGSKLSRYGDVIAEKTGLGRSWIGLVLLASVTSLPELVTGISAVTYVDVPDIAVGNVLGACVVNMLTLALLDMFQRQSPLSTRAHHGHVLSAGFGILLLSVVALTIFLGDRVASVGWIGVNTLVFIVTYLVAMRLAYFYEKRQIAAFLKEVAVEMKYRDISMRRAVFLYAANAAVVVAAAVFLPEIGERIAAKTGLGQTFVGNVFIALSTTLPEITVSIAAMKLDAVDLAIGNLFGSNIFNILILAIDDFLFLRGPLLSSVHTEHIVPALSAILMTTVAIVGLTYRAEKKPLFLAWDSIAILMMYILNVLVLYALK